MNMAKTVKFTIISFKNSTIFFGWDRKGRKQYYYTFGLFRINHNLAYTYEWDLQNKIGNASLIREAIIHQVGRLYDMKYGDIFPFCSMFRNAYQDSFIAAILDIHTILEFIP